MALVFGLLGAAPLPAKAADSKTLENLMAAYNGESNAHAKYLAYAEKAEKEGYGKVASLFRAAAHAENVHLTSHAVVIKSMGGTSKADIKLPEIKSTKENLEDALKGENYERTTMYPEFIGVAEAEGNQKAKWTFDMANKVEKIHHGLYEAALMQVNAGQASTGKSYHVCQVCGMTVEGDTPEKCPVCGAPRAQFKKVD